MTVFLEKVAQDLISKFGNNLPDCHLVFNNNRPALYLKRYLSQEIGKAFFSPRFHTIQPFFAELAESKIADHYLQVFTLMKVYNQLLKVEGKSPLRSETFFPLASTILSDFAQINVELAEANTLFSDMSDIAQIEQTFDFLSKEQHDFLSRFWQSYSELKHQERKQKFMELWLRLPKLFDGFHQELTLLGYTTPSMTYRQLANTPLDSLSFLNTLNEGKIIFIGFNALSKAESQIFKALQEQNKAIFYFDTDAHYLNDELNEAGLFLRKNFQIAGLKNTLETNENRFTEAQKKIDVFSVQGKTTQAKIINKMISFRDLNSKNISETAIILADESLLIPTLQSIPVDVLVNISMGYSLAQSPIYGICDLWLDSQIALSTSDELDYHLLEAIVTHPLSGFSEKLTNGILEGLIKEKLTKVNIERIKKHGGLLTLFFEKISGSEELIPRLNTLVQFLLDRQISRNTLKKLDSSLFIRTLQCLNRLNDTLQAFISHEELFFAAQLIRKALKEVSAPLEEKASLEKSATQGLQVMGLLESRSLNFKNLIFLGFNEGIVPKSSLANSFIPDSIRRAYGLPVAENLDAVSAYMVYRLIQGADRVCLVYNSQSEGTNKGEVSRFLKQLEYECPFQFNYFQMNLQGSTETRQQISIDKKHPVIQKELKRYLNGQISISPSSIVSYICNPIDFFFNKIAKIKEPKEVSETIKVKEIGNVIHRTMEWFYIDHKNEEITAALIIEKQKKLKHIIQKALIYVLELNPLTTEFTAEQKIVLAVVESYAKKLIEKDITDAPFTLLALEQKFEGGLTLRINGEEKRIKLSGYIDRIDKKQGITRIIDYKSGSDKVSYSSIAKLFDTHDNKINKAMIQMLIYTYAFAEANPQDQVEPNLFVIKNLEKTHFSKRNFKLEASQIDEVKEEFLTELGNKLAELFDEETPFYASEKAENYPYSIYTELFDSPPSKQFFN